MDTTGHLDVSENRPMWVKQCHIKHPPVITIFIGAMLLCLPFPIMGGLWIYVIFPH